MIGLEPTFSILGIAVFAVRRHPLPLLIAYTFMLVKVLFLLLISLSSYAQTEYSCNKEFCKSVGGLREVSYQYKDTNIRVDCITDDRVYEAGLDKRSSLDSIHQAAFAEQLTGKKGTVVIFDTDGKEGSYEYQIRMVAKQYRVKYISYPCDC